MKTIDEIQRELKVLINELNQLKEEKADVNLNLDFKKLTAYGKRYPICPHPLEKCDMHTKKCYLLLLLSLVSYDKEAVYSSLQLIHRIAFGCKYLTGEMDLKEEFVSAQIMTFEQSDEATVLFKNNDMRLLLVLEMLLITGYFTKGKKAALEYTAEICILLNVAKEELLFLSNMAAVILTGDLKQYKCQIANKYNLFTVYLKDLPFKREIINLKLSEDIHFGGNNFSAWFFSEVSNIEGKNRKYLSSVMIKKENNRIKYSFNKFVDNHIEESIEEELSECKYSPDIDGNFFILKNRVIERENDGIIPVGVKSHYLDNSYDDAMKFFLKHGGKLNEE